MKCKLVVGDMHLPFVDQRSLNAVYSAISSHKPTHIIQIGDLMDLYSWARFPRYHTFIRPDTEILEARKMAERFWMKCQKLAPGAICYQLLGNHDERITKKILSSNVPEAEYLVRDRLRELYKFDGVNTQKSERDELILDGVMYMHGFRSRIGDHARHNNMSTVCGHIHRGGTVFIRSGNDVIWECNAGFIADASSLPLSYTRQRIVSNWTQGYALIFTSGPMFIPLKNRV